MQAFRRHGRLLLPGYSGIGEQVRVGLSSALNTSRIGRSPMPPLSPVLPWGLRMLFMASLLFWTMKICTISSSPRCRPVLKSVANSFKIIQGREAVDPMDGWLLSRGSDALWILLASVSFYASTTPGRSYSGRERAWLAKFHSSTLNLLTQTRAKAQHFGSHSRAMACQSQATGKKNIYV